MCEFTIEKEVDGIKGIYRCNNPYEGYIMRCKGVCKKHYHILHRDNKLRIRKELDIPESFELLRRGKWDDNTCTILIPKDLNTQEII